jgi:hypothetical protein
VRVAIITIGLLFFSCNNAKKVTISRRDFTPTMTNRQLTDSLVKVSTELNDIKEVMLMPDPSVFEMRDGFLVFKSKVVFDSVQIKGWLFVGVDTSFHVELPLDSLRLVR